MIFQTLGVAEITQEDCGVSEKRMGPQMEPWGTTKLKGQKEKEEPTKKTESQPAETEECGIIEVQGGKLSKCAPMAW